MNISSATQKAPEQQRRTARRGPPISSRTASPIAPRSAPILIVLATSSSATTPCSSQPRIVPAQVAGDAVAGRPADPGADLLDRRHQRIGEQQRPADAEAELRAGLAIGGDAAGIVVGGAGDEAGPQRLEDGQCNALGLTGAVLGVCRRHGRSRPVAHAPGPIRAELQLAGVELVRRSRYSCPGQQFEGAVFWLRRIRAARHRSYYEPSSPWLPRQS